MRSRWHCVGSMWRSEESREVLTFGPRRWLLWSHSMVAIFKKSRLLVLLCFARRCGAHMRHIGSPLVLLMCISRDHKLFELLRLTFFCVCMLVSRSWKHLQCAWHQAHRGRVAFSRCHAMNVRCSDTPLWKSQTLSNERVLLAKVL